MSVLRVVRAAGLVGVLILAAVVASPSDAEATHNPVVRRLTASLPATSLMVEAQVVCLQLFDDHTEERFVCYVSFGSGPVPPPPPPPYQPGVHQVLSADVGPTSLTWTFLECAQLVPGVLAVQTQLVEVVGGTGSITLSTDEAAPFTCAPGAGTTMVSGPLTWQEVTFNHNEDALEVPGYPGQLFDVCPDRRELAAPLVPDDPDSPDGPGKRGTLRDPFNPYDYYDVNGDGVIDLGNDILGVINHYSPTGAPPYDIAFDRGPSLGPNPWNLGPPDGVIDLGNDIMGVINQYGHDCR